MSEELNGVSQPSTSTSGVSTPTQAPVQSQSTGTQPAQPSTAQPITIKVNGQDRQMTYDDLIVHAQKGLSADEKFREAAQLREQASKYESAFTNLQNIITKKDKSALKQILGEDFFAPEAPKPAYDDTDLRLAQTLGVDIDQFVEAKKRSMGLDNPLVVQQHQKITQLESMLQDVLNKVKTVEQSSRTQGIKEQVDSIASKYPKADKLKAIDIMLNKGIPLNQAELVFQELHNQKINELEEYYNNKIKEKQNNTQGLNINQGGLLTDTDQFTGKSLADKAELLKKMFGG